MTRRDIKKIVKDAINNILIEGTTDVEIYNKPFELKYLSKNNLKEKIISDVTNELSNIINNNGDFASLHFSKICHILVPKKTFYDFRKCAWIDIIDEIKYLSLALILAPKIEKKRLDKKTIFSYRYKLYENGRIFNKNYNYSSFKENYIEKCLIKKYKIMIECDIANFYDRLNLHRLESTLLSIEDCDRKIIEIVNELLLYWANRDSYGLPVGSNASRILAEAFLIEIDNFLKSRKIVFCRFVDDYRIYARNMTEANHYLSLFVEMLNKYGISINLQKTKIKDINESKREGNKKEKPELTEIQKQQISSIIRGYSGLIPAKFRRLSNNEITQLNNEDDILILEKLENSQIIEPKDITKYIRIIVAKQKYSDFIKLPNILKKFPQFIPYFVDVLNKTKNNLTEIDYKKIMKEITEWLNKDEVPEYILISLIKLYNSSDNEEKKFLFEYFKNLKRNSGIYIGRATLEQLGFSLTRGELLELKDYFLRADIWEQRQILRMILNGLSEGENRPFIKDLKINSKDYFILEIIADYEKGKKKKR